MINCIALAKTCATALVVYHTIYCADAFETSADEVSIDTKRGVQTLTGNVVVIYGSRIFRASKIVIWQDGRSIREIVATGDVSLQDEETIITATTCRYDADLVIFSGSVIVQNSEIGTAKADKVTYNLATKKIDFTAGSKVELVLSPNRKIKLLRCK
ncbi:MAG: hypothetical protein LBD43_03415 [Holosporales bacterium]|jgi:lipopolysaccharide transport protein LptA|nr:hypothetical protein [Holosporales bacterium]